MKVPYVVVLKAMYGMLESGLLFYKKARGDMENIRLVLVTLHHANLCSFDMNSYDSTVFSIDICPS